MTLPVLPLVRPSVLAGQANGQLDPAILVTTPGLAGGPDVVLVEPAARAWRALTSAALFEGGHVLKATSMYDSYRPRHVQQRIFDQRYTTSYTGIGCKVCGGRRYCKRSSGYATAACPGTSNHGWGLAVDTGLELDGDTGTESISSNKDALKWLVENEHRFGFSHEVQSEPWHIRYAAGDAIPGEVLAFEANNQAPGFVTLREGARGEPVFWIQGILNMVGCPVGEPDGIWGPITTMGVICWQSKLQITADGIWGPTTEAKTKEFFAWLAAQNARPVLREGDRGEHVVHLQHRLHDHGYGGAGISSFDGAFGPAVTRAVRNFQTDHGLTVDGIVGPATWTALG